MNRTTVILLGLLFAFGGLASIGPTASAQEEQVVVTDPSGDVMPYPGTTNKNAAPTPVEVPIPVEQLTGPADVTGFRIHGETATDLSFELSIADFARLNTWYPQNIFLSLCFDWSGTGATYRFFYSYGFSNPKGPEVTVQPKFDGGAFERVEECAPHDYLPNGRVFGMYSGVFPFEEDRAAGTLKWSIPRSVFETMHPDFHKDGSVEPRPKTGDTLSNIRAFAVTRGGPGFFTYDTTDSAEFTFKMDTGNDKVKVLIPKNTQVGRGVGGWDTPLFGIEAGSYQIVPITIENHLPTAIEPNITTRVLAGDESKWEIRTLPSVPVPAAQGDTPGRATLTMIVNSVPEVQHKELVRVLVTALDPKEPHLGAQAVDIVPVAPPEAGEATLYFHANGDPCQSVNRWINTLKADSTGTVNELPFHSCDPQSTGNGRTFTDDVSYFFSPDVPFARDYLLSTTNAAQATLFLRSVIRQSAPTQVDVPASMAANIKVEILSGTEVIGEGKKENQLITADLTRVDIPVKVLGEILGGNGREVPNDKGLNIRVGVEAEARTFEIGGCIQETCVPEDDQEVQGLGGKVHMDLTQSNIVIPILKTERAGEVYNITKSGALISLRLADGDKKVFVNPGKVAVYNLTVRNEGVNVDTAKISGIVDQEGWKVEFLPASEYKLKVGEPRNFYARVTAPATAGEGHTLRLDVIATSKLDPEATARLPLFIEVTTGQVIDEAVAPVGEAPVEAETPAPALFPLLALIAWAGILLRRRR